MGTNSSDIELCLNTTTEENELLTQRRSNIQVKNNAPKGNTENSDQEQYENVNRDDSDKVINSEKRRSQDEESRLPDGGWGWVVVFGASLVLVLVDIIGQCFGIVFSTFLLDLNTSSVMTAWIFNMFGFLWCLTGPPLSPLITEFGWRKVTFLASIMLAASTISSAFVESAWVLFFTYSALGGIACGFLSNISYMIVPHYFTTRRGFASGIIMMWDCGGQLLGSPIIKHLQDEYTYKGATLILGGIVLNCCIGAAVFHPVEWHLKPKNKGGRFPDTGDEGKDDHQVPLHNPDDLQVPLHNSDDLQVRGKESDGNVLLHDKSESIQVEGHDPKASKVSTRTVVLRIIKATLEDLRILASARAIIIAIGATVIFNGYLNFLAFVPFALQEAGHSLGDAATSVSVSAICNMLTRITIASLSDTKLFSFRVCYMLGSLTITATMLTFTALEDITWIKVIMGLWGCGVGAFMSIFNLIMVHYMGLDKFMPMLGATMLFIASGYLTIGPLAGYIRDATQSYTITIWMLSATVFSSFILWMFMPAAERYDSRRREKKESELASGS